MIPHLYFRFCFCFYFQTRFLNYSQGLGLIFIIIKFMILKDIVTIFALVNGMIAFNFLVLPVAALQSGYITSLICCVVTYLINLYTSYLTLEHLGDSKTVQQMLQKHFTKKSKFLTFYHIMYALINICVSIIVFKMLCLQIQSLFGYSQWCGPMIAIFLFIQLLILRKYDLTEITLALGVINYVAFVVFEGFAIQSAPQGQKTVPKLLDFRSIVPILFCAFIVHLILIDVLIKNKNRKNYFKFNSIAMFITFVFYCLFILGAFCIVNKSSIKKHPESIIDFFVQDSWTVHFISIIACLSFIFVLPQYLAVSKKRIFDLFGIKQQINISLSELLYIMIFLIASLVVYLLDIRVESMISATSIFSYFCGIFIPVAIHLKCLYFNTKQKHHEFQIEEDDSFQVQISQCNYHSPNSSKCYQIIQIIIISIIVVFGFLYFGVFPVIDFVNNI